jgi:hypothetical protein
MEACQANRYLFQTADQAICPQWGSGAMGQTKEVFQMWQALFFIFPWAVESGGCIKYPHTETAEKTWV